MCLAVNKFLSCSGKATPAPQRYNIPLFSQAHLVTSVSECLTLRQTKVAVFFLSLSVTDFSLQTKALQVIFLRANTTSEGVSWAFQGHYISMFFWNTSVWSTHTLVPNPGIREVQLFPHCPLRKSLWRLRYNFKSGEKCPRTAWLVFQTVNFLHHYHIQCFHVTKHFIPDHCFSVPHFFETELLYFYYNLTSSKYRLVL